MLGLESLIPSCQLYRLRCSILFLSFDSPFSFFFIFLLHLLYRLILLCLLHWFKVLCFFTNPSLLLCLWRRGFLLLVLLPFTFKIIYGKNEIKLTILNDPSSLTSLALFIKGRGRVSNQMGYPPKLPVRPLEIGQVLSFLIIYLKDQEIRH